MHLNEFETLLNELLTPNIIKDYCPNGLQVQGADQVKKIITGVTASQALIEQAIAQKADALVVHHGYFWKNEDYVIRGLKYKRIKALIDNNISLFAYHLPLDVHPTLGNNVQLANILGIENITPLDIHNPPSICLRGVLANPISGSAFSEHISNVLQRQCLHVASNTNQAITTVAWCTGGGQNFIQLAAEQGIDAFISGEISEKTTHVAREANIHYFAAGHHATERYGVKALAEYLSAHYQLDASFIDIDNPA